MEHICNTCGGSGQVPKQTGWMYYLDTCPDCKGKGSIGSNPVPMGWMIVAILLIGIIIYVINRN